MNVVSIITARGGSKGIPHKNIKLLNGKPLIEYSIDESLSSKLINETYVTSEDKDIIQISMKSGANIIYRPLELAQDDSSSVDVILHSLNYLEINNKLPDFFVLLQPTSPLRTSKDIDNAINLFINNDCDALVSVCELEHNALLNLTIKNNFLESNCDEKFLNMRRQELPTFYSPNGAIYIIKTKVIQKEKTFFPKKTIPYIMPQERSVDLDTEFDFKLAEFLLTSGVSNEK